MVKFVECGSSPFLLRKSSNFGWFNSFNSTGAALAAATATGAMRRRNWIIMFSQSPKDRFNSLKPGISGGITS